MLNDDVVHVDLVMTLCYNKVGLKRGPGCRKKDQLLTGYINCEDMSPHLLKQAGLLRYDKSCCLHRMNHLCPSIKRGQIAPNEDLIPHLHGTEAKREGPIPKSEISLYVMVVAFGKGTVNPRGGSVVDPVDPDLEDPGSPMYSAVGSNWIMEGDDGEDKDL
ncbi:transcription factor MYB14-like [Eucalyptus grandis]|uniref:transcription factor MYB14-like n=1 Tax=Eucalyptus grandis TaxID=71139 RepID=UPI00192EFAF4|nr:transcription factor MYB14-like [Eucalyptus grandis]